ncbi:MAG: response regulator [Deltaproteobacteria bacterium]|jgi:two-component system phosphate regulon response regulator PhoB
MPKKKILIVDDEMDIRIFLSTLLETSGYKAIIAANGEEGIREAREHKPAAIILDVLMPKAGGIQMYRQVKTDEDLKTTPVIMISAIAKKTFFHSMKLLNSYRGEMVPPPEAYIEKPPESDELLEVLAKFIR